MRTFVCLVALVTIVVAVPIKINPKEDWWTHAVFYQIYPLSYKDSNGDGYGDLTGITQKLDYLKDLGIDGVWLSPIYPTPLADFTYDISNYRDIDPLFGNLDIFDAFVARAKELGSSELSIYLYVPDNEFGITGIRVIMDYVPDYTSDEHVWFSHSVHRIDPYTDYYMWDNGKHNEAGKRLPPNNWQSVFGGDAWKFDEVREQWFLHQFTPKQPDLNWSNPYLVEDMKDVMRYWLDRGVDGFRVDAVPWLFEGSFDNNDMYSPQNLPETYNAVKIWRSVADEKTAQYGETKILMLEVYGTEDQVMEYYGTPDSPGGHFPFNFRFITDLNSSSTAHDFSNVLNNYLVHVSQAADRVPNWVLGNHDQHRVADRYDPQLVEGMHFLSLLLPGIAVTFNGEEIGMLDTYITWEECLDPQGVNQGPEGYLNHTRDLERTPFQWDGTANSGFSDGAKTWLPVNPNYQELNVETENIAEKSHIKVYKQLIQLRKEPTFRDGETEILALTNNVLAFTRTLEGYETYVILLNVGNITENVGLVTAYPYLPSQLTIVAASIYSEHEIGTVQDPVDITVRPKEAFVFTTAVQK